MSRGRVLVAMSGGVDSSVAAALLHADGYEVIGATMKLTCGDALQVDRPCCSLDSVNDARRVCESLGVPHYVLDLASAFSRDVVRDFAEEYARGRTPIPCVRCNTFTKFRDLARKAAALDCDFVATGHYAQVHAGALHRGLDPAKDQSYFLWGLERAVLSRLLLPVGGRTKAETRAAAHALGLRVVAEKAESMDICFVPDGDHVAVIRRELGDDAPALQRGPFVDAHGTVLGEHDGHARFTIGQRKGLPGGFAAPMYVVAIEPATRAVVLGPREALLGRGVIARGMNWLVAAPPRPGDTLLVQHRHRATPVEATVVRREDDLLEVALETPLSAIAPGQSLVCYDGTRVLGGGVIEAGLAMPAPPRPLPILAA